MARVLAGTSPEGRNRIMIIAAVVFAAIAGVLLFVALQSRDDDGGGLSAAAAIDVVVTTRSIDPNTLLTSDMLELDAVPADQALAGVFTSVERVVGLPVRYPLQKGEQVSTSKLGLQAIEDENDIALVLPPGMRGVAVEASEVTAVGGLLLPGNFVDVIAVRSETIEEEGRPESPPVAITVLQNVLVLSVAQEAQEPVPAAPSEDETTEEGETTQGAEVGQNIRAQRPEDVERQPSARSVTLAVTPDQAQLLALLQASGDLEVWLALRATDDDAIAPLGETNVPPALLPPP